jgi:hypothetical protein
LPESIEENSARRDQSSAAAMSCASYPRVTAAICFRAAFIAAMFAE